MNKDKYAAMMARKEIVKDFISKMDSVSVKDVSLIPALMDYIETGNKGMFDEYLDFHFIKDEEKKICELNDSNARIEDKMKCLNNTIEAYKKVKADYYIATEDFRNWRHDVLSQVDTDTNCSNADAIKEFLSVIDSMKYLEKRKVYVVVDDKMYSITSARLTENNKIVFDTKYAFQVPIPPYIRPRCSYLDVDLYDFENLNYEKRGCRKSTALKDFFFGKEK